MKISSVADRLCCAATFLALLVVVSSDEPNDRLWPVGCVQPGCLTEFDRDTLWPYEDPNFFLQCEPAGDTGGVQWELVRQPCQGRRLFHFARQQCTLPEDWEAACPEQGGPGLPLEPCPTPTCDTPADLRRLWPEQNSGRFLQCIPLATGGIVPMMQTCPGWTLFSVRYQACITPLRWQQECSFDGGEITPDPTGPEPTSTTVAPTTTTTTTTMPTTTTTAAPPTTPITPPTTLQPEWTLCQMPNCMPDDQILYPHTERTLYWQCVPQPTGFWLAQQRPCGAGTFFHYGLQLCVFPVDWVNFCPMV